MPAQLTGRKVAAITVGAFGVIVAVNVALAVSAVRTFPGLETPNSYVASQHFDAERAAQESLGWRVEAEAAPDGVSLAVLDDAGRPARVARLFSVIGRPTHVADDQELVFLQDGGIWRAAANLAPGRWALRLTAEAEDGTPFRQRLDLRVRPR